MMPGPLYYYHYDSHHFVSMDGKNWLELNRRPTANDRRTIVLYFRIFDDPDDPEITGEPIPVCLTDRWLHLYAGYTPDEAERI